MTDTVREFFGFDDWTRELWLMESGAVLVDVDGELHTRTPDWDEPLTPTGIKTPERKASSD